LNRKRPQIGRTLKKIRNLINYASKFGGNNENSIPT
jgi:hypothetical protein